MLTGPADVRHKLWMHGVFVSEVAMTQLIPLAQMPFLFRHIAVMPDVHAGMRSTISSAIATRQAIIPAAVSLDIGRGVMAVKTALSFSDMDYPLSDLRKAIEPAIPHGRIPGETDPGKWQHPPESIVECWETSL